MIVVSTQLLIKAAAQMALARSASKAAVDRSICTDHEAMMSALSPTVAGLGRNWVRYDESEKPHETKVKPAEIIAAYPVLAVLKSVAHNLSCSKTAWHKCVVGLLDKHKDAKSWKVKP